MGIAWDNESNKLDALKLEENVQKMLDEVNNENTFSATFKLSDLHINYYGIKQQKEIKSSIFKNLKSVDNIAVIKSDNILQSKKADYTVNNIKENFSIAGSFHKYMPQGGMCWYNQQTNYTTECDSNISEPHMGDGNARYDAGYWWMPTYLKVSTVQAHLQRYVTIIDLDFQYNQADLDNLNVDDSA